MLEIVQKLNDLLAQLNALQVALTDAQAAADSIAKEADSAGFARGQSDLDAKVAEAYAKGVADGKAAGGSDKIYSQAELDAIVNPLKDEVAALTSQLSSVQGDLDALKASVAASIAAAVAKAKDDLKASLKALVQSEEVDLEGKIDLF